MPSVAFVVDIPEMSTDSFFSGQIFVTNKDKVTQPSSALRHASEMVGMIRTHYSTNSIVASKPVMIVSDGGPDHRVTFGSVKVANLFCLEHWTWTCSFAFIPVHISPGKTLLNM